MNFNKPVAFTDHSMMKVSADYTTLVSQATGDGIKRDLTNLQSMILNGHIPLDFMLQSDFAA